MPAFVSPIYCIWCAYSLMPILRRLRQVRRIVDMIRSLERKRLVEECKVVGEVGLSEDTLHNLS